MNSFKSKKPKPKFLHLKKRLQFSSSVILLLCLTGCMGVYEGGFECPPGIGVGCKSISEVNEMVDQCSLPSAQCSIPSIEQSGSEIPDIWYAPGAVNSQGSISSIQKCPIETSHPHVKGKRERDKADVQDSI